MIDRLERCVHHPSVSHCPTNKWTPTRRWRWGQGTGVPPPRSSISRLSSSPRYVALPTVVRSCGVVQLRPLPLPTRRRKLTRERSFFFFFPNLGMPTTEGRHRCVARDTVPHRTRTRWDDRLSGSFLPRHDQRSTGSSPSFTTCVEDVGLDAVRDGADAGAVLCV